MINKANASHIGSCLSLADVLAVLYTYIIEPKNFEDSPHDVVILKPHCSAIYYAILALKKILPLETLDGFCQNENVLTPHLNNNIPGMSFTSSSLGHNLSMACGNALALKKLRKPNKVYCIVGDGELQEGSNWEAIMFAAQHNLSNLTLIVDFNKLQALGAVSSILNLENIESKFQSFGWVCRRINGHDHKEIIKAFQKKHSEKKPLVIVCDTIKGKGVSFMENNIKFHYSCPNDDELERAIKEIENETNLHK